MNYAEKNIVKTIEEDFYNSFGAFSSEESVEEIIADRKFRNKEINL